MARNETASGNLLLNRMDQPASDLLLPHLTRMPLQREQRLAEVRERMEYVHFLEGGVASAVSGSSRTEVGLVGREGIIGIGTILGDDVTPFEFLIRIAGATALSMPAEELGRAAEAHPPLRRLLGQYASYFLSQVSYGIVACAQQLMEARLARWLLMCHDRLEGDELPLTHEAMATMISAQRSGVTVTLHTLEGAGMIRSTRGLVTIRDREKLAELAGDSYGIPEARYRELIGPFGKSP
jgi:CRP-like cAMP-binding protein